MLRSDMISRKSDQNTAFGCYWVCGSLAIGQWHQLQDDAVTTNCPETPYGPYTC